MENHAPDHRVRPTMQNLMDSNQRANSFRLNCKRTLCLEQLHQFDNAKCPYFYLFRIPGNCLQHPYPLGYG